MSDDSYEMPEHGWTCFHCGETFTTVGGARDHFGATPDAQPGCLIRVQLGEERGLQMELRKAEAEIASLRAANEQLDYEAGHARAMEMEIGRRFKNGARSVQDAFNLFDSMEGRALAAEERAAQLGALLNTPEIHDFAKAVTLEAAHQRERWKTNDPAKDDADWFWLVGYLAGKALHTPIMKDCAEGLTFGPPTAILDKKLHRIITVAAACANWHAYVSTVRSEQSVAP